MTELTLLNSMAGTDFPAALETHLAWGLRVLDLKDGIFGKGIAELSDEEALRVGEMIRARGLTVHCLSSILFHPAVELGEAAFAREQLAPLDRLLAVARILEPAMIRLLAPQTEQRSALTDVQPYLRAEHPWLIPMMGEAVDRIHAAGFQATIENECGRCIFSTPTEVVEFFAALDRPGCVSFTWDVQNMWEVGAFPTLEVYQRLQPLIGFYHVKGGQHDGTSTRLRWRTALEDASWPVLEITRQVVADGVSPVICLNPPHGQPKPGYAWEDITRRDLAFLRREISEIR